MSPDSSAAMASDEWWQLALGDADWDGKEWDGYWDGEWSDWWKMAWDGEEGWGDSYPEHLEAEEPKVEPLNYANPSGDEIATVNGMFWHPFNSELHVEVGEMVSSTMGKDGEWTAHYHGDDGNFYLLTCLGKNSEGGDPKRKLDPVKIQYKPISKKGVSEFSERAWPNAGSPSGSGIVRDAKGPSSLDLDIEREMLKYESIFSKDRAFVAFQLDCQLGDKPKGNTNPLELSVLTGMTLGEHISHVKFYETTGAFKAQFSDDTPEELWGELCEIFKIWHAYNIDDPENVETMLRAKYAHEYFAI